MQDNSEKRLLVQDSLFQSDEDGCISKVLGTDEKTSPEMADYIKSNIFKLTDELCNIVDNLNIEDKINFLNDIRQKLHRISPFKDEPVDCVVWVKKEIVQSNDYNPNTVAPPEMKLLEISITEDGYTQPIVGFLEDETVIVVDGFHRHRVGKETPAIRERIYDRLPVVAINESRQDRSDRIAATIRHNRARGKHQVSAMSDIVIELKRRNWSNEKISRELGMDADEVLRLTQITGLAAAFADRDFSEAWEESQEKE